MLLHPGQDMLRNMAGRDGAAPAKARPVVDVNVDEQHLVRLHGMIIATFDLPSGGALE
jgi:hypothetical protein